MNILNLFRREKPITRQLEEFIDYKRTTKGNCIAVEHKECLITFFTVSHLQSVEELTLDHVSLFKDWLLNKHGSSYLVEKNIHSVRCFLRFYRKFAIIHEMNRLGRKPDYISIAKVKLLRSQKKSYREIIAEFKKEGRKIQKTQVARWANKVLK